MLQQNLFVILIWIFFFLVFIAVAHASTVDLFHGSQQLPVRGAGNQPSLIRPAFDASSATLLPESSTPINLAPANEGEFFDGTEFVPYRSSRHDEFDWALTKVSYVNDVEMHRHVNCVKQQENVYNRSVLIFF